MAANNVSLVIPENHQKTMIDHADQNRHVEVCGMLGGLIQGNLWRIANCIPTKNVAADTRTNYAIDPAQFVEGFFALQQQQKRLLGIYHSHPFGPSTPSPTDIAQTTWPDLVYVILYPTDDDNFAISAWQIVNKQAYPVSVKS